MQTELFDRLKRIDHLIQIKGTGTADQLAQKLGMSRRSVYNHLNKMKDLGAPIKFCPYKQSYYYDEDGFFKISFYFKRNKSERIEI
jgi:predicted DNA-binding transcriptional regulator YafY